MSETNWQQRAEALEQIVKDTLWMARRYANGRSTSATALCNEAIKRALLFDVDIGPDRPEGIFWAHDEMGDIFAGLTEEDLAYEWERLGKESVS